MATVKFLYPGFPSVRLSDREDISFFVGGLVYIAKETLKPVEFQVVSHDGIKDELILAKVDGGFSLTCGGQEAFDCESISTVIYWLHETYCLGNKLNK